MKKAALIYDFDGTLAQGNMQEHSFLPTLNIEPAEFWRKSNGEAESQDADKILTYMREMLVRAAAANVKITRRVLQDHGKDLSLFRGVTTWFERMNEYAESQGLELEHFVISSGVREMIEGCEVASEFKQIFASSFLYENEVAVWPGLSINYTTKTQYLFRINKGIENCWDDTAVNKWIPESQRPYPFHNMIFIGDGETDIPTMKMVRHQGGYAVAVFDPDKWDHLQQRIHGLIAEDRANFVAAADYSEGSQLDVTVKGLLGRIGMVER
jgi:phosphoserine phosphatase